MTGTEADRLARAATQIMLGWTAAAAGADLTLRDFFQSRGNARISAARARGVRSLRATLREEVRGAFDVIVDWDDAHRLVAEALAAEGLSFDEYGLRPDRVVAAVLKRGRIATEWEWHLVRARADRGDHPQTDRLLEMIDRFGM